ncbi:putative methyltransferase PMT2 [Wolffia australiana]
MGSKMNASGRRTRNSISIIFVVGLCCFFYVLGAWQKSGVGKGDSIAQIINRGTDCTILPNLIYQTHPPIESSPPDDSNLKRKVFKPCASRYSDYTPCQDQKRAMTFARENMIYRERHCPPPSEKLRCLIPTPKGYVTPFPWPKSRDYVPYANVPHKTLTVEKAVQNWVQLKGDVFKFPGGGTMFPQGADAYIDELASVIPLSDGTVRTALDTGCGVASWGAYMLKRNVLTMSFAPRDSHEAQVHFALERGVPAVIGVLGTIRLPYPPRAFDMAHCSRCLIPWTSNGGMYMMEVDRVLRPGGYWVLSGPPINWKTYFRTWNRSEEDLQKEQKRIEQMAELLCWEKKYERGDVAIWRKKINSNLCRKRNNVVPITMCPADEEGNIWYNKMKLCRTPIPVVERIDQVSGGKLKKFPQRLFSVPPRIVEGDVDGVTARSFEEDSSLWKKRVNAYKKVNKEFGSGRYRNIMDMNAVLGSFAAAIESSNSWVMNVVPTVSPKDTLGVVFERGLIGIYHDWCEAFSTYPRTYDLIHADGVFSLYENRCEIEDILLEMDRILRPEGAVLIRDTIEIINKVKKIVDGVRWTVKMTYLDGGSSVEEVLVAVKQNWVRESST